MEVELMGSETAKALRARRREAAAASARLLAAVDERSPIGAARRERIKAAASLARRRLKTLAVAHQRVDEIEVEVGQALIRIVDQGLSRNEAYELVGLSRHLGRRYLDLASYPRGNAPTNSSAASAVAEGPTPSGADGGHHGDRTVADPPGRNI